MKLLNNKRIVNGYMERVKAVQIDENSLGIFWLGQAGFLLKTPGGTLIAIDPYLSDCCERIAGFKRIMLPVLYPYEMDVDYLIVSHEHPDHFDADLIEELKGKDHIKIMGPQECKRKAMDIGVRPEQYILLEENKVLNLNEFSLLPVRADHGELSLDALGFLFDFGFVKVYFSGDTAYSPDKLKTVINMNPEIALLPINGEFGNLNSREAVQLAKDLKSKVVIPCHYWTFIEHGANPLEFKKAMEKEFPQCDPVFMAQGEGYIWTGL